MTRSRKPAQVEKTQEQYIAELEEYAAKLKEMVESQTSTDLKPVVEKRKIPWGDIAPWAVMIAVGVGLFIRNIKSDPTPEPGPKPPTSWQMVRDYYPTLVKRHKTTYNKVAAAIRDGSIKTDKAMYDALLPDFAENRKSLDTELDKFFDGALPRNEDGSFTGDKDLKEPAAKFLETLADNL